ncbi:MAG: NADH-quinone oxidoreductase subunit L, partial [Pseudomonadota bacterium]
MLQDQYYLLAIIVALPLAGAILNGFLLDWTGRVLGGKAHKMLTSRPVVAAIAVSAIAMPFFIALYAIFKHLPLMKGGEEEAPWLTYTMWNWIKVGGISLDLKLLLDPLSAVMLLVVTGVSSVIHFYSTGYMAHDPSHRRYFAYLNLFVFFMVMLILGDNLAVMFIGWEGVGLCSYLLIGFWYEDKAKAVAGKKAFVVNRIGDFGFLLGIFLVGSVTGHLDFAGIRENAFMLGTGEVLGISTITLACLLFFVGATGKSAQLPLYVWLPDAMAGPTPVSALIHAATMVTAGVYMIARLNFLYIMSPPALAVVALVGAATAVFAAMIGFAQNDIKKVLAYSTVSQLGYMFMAVGVGAFSVGIFHLMTHAFFKACLFLGAGSVIHAMHERQDIQEMGGLRKKLPHTHWTFFVSVLAISGAPFFSGFFSKDEILWRAFSASFAYAPWVPKTVWIMGVLAAGMTAFYMFRLYFLTFCGKFRGPTDLADKVHESPWTMTVPLMILGTLAVIGGWVGAPHVFQIPNYIHHYLEPVIVEIPSQGSNPEEWGVMGLGLGMALFGFSIAWLLYGKGPSFALMKITGAMPRLYRLVAGKFYVDEIYGFLIVRPIGWIAALCHRVVDRFIIDKIMVEGSARVADAGGWILRKAQGGIVHRYGWVMALGVAIFIYMGAVPRPAVDWTVDDDGTARFTQVYRSTDYKYSWDFDDDGNFEMIWTDANVVTHTYQGKGRYKAVLKTRSSWGFEREKDCTILVGD